MSSKFTVLVGCFILLACGLLALVMNKANPVVQVSGSASSSSEMVQSIPENANDAPTGSSTEPVPETSVLSWPVDRAYERITKKPFGLLVRPGNSPVSPERFSGYHTGVDFEIFPEEISVTVRVRAICDGELLVKRSATGYGGVAVQACRLNDQPVTVIYGHLALASIDKQVGNDLKQGKTFAVLGEGNSTETDGERKHLHLAIHRGSAVNILGYVQQPRLLKEWLDLRALLSE